MQKESEWFQEWFNKEYLLLYSHRDVKQAEQQVDMVWGHCGFDPEKRPDVLDVAAGEGRHLQAMRNKPCRMMGFDLSLDLLKSARRENLPVAQGDMRKIPFREQCFNLVTCFFSSFGYFKTPEDDLAVLKEISARVKPGGFLFLDLMNKKVVVNNLVPRSERTLEGFTVLEERFVEERIVVKNLTLTQIKPDQKGEVKNYQEKVRMYTLEEISILSEALGLKIQNVFGDEKGSDYNPDMSKRMSLLMQRDSKSSRNNEPYKGSLF